MECVCEIIILNVVLKKIVYKDILETILLLSIQFSLFRGEPFGDCINM